MVNLKVLFGCVANKSNLKVQIKKKQGQENNVILFWDVNKTNINGF